MRSKKRFLFLEILLLVSIFLIPMFSALSCSLSNVGCGSGRELMSLSGSTNAHGELASADGFQSGTQHLCCDFNLGSSTCGNNNKVLALSSETNAHAESPTATGGFYTQDVCWEAFTGCESTTEASCANGKIGILSLSSDTNAHLGPYSGGYLTKICCGTGGVKEVHWENINKEKITSLIVAAPDLNKDVKTEVKIIGTNLGAEGASVKIGIWEYSTTLGVDALSADKKIREKEGNQDYRIIAELGQGGSLETTWEITSTDLNKGGDKGFYVIIYDKDEKIIFKGENAGDRLGISFLEIICASYQGIGNYPEKFCGIEGAYDPCNLGFPADKDTDLSNDCGKTWSPRSGCFYTKNCKTEWSSQDSKCQVKEEEIQEGSCSAGTTDVAAGGTAIGNIGDTLQVVAGTSGIATQDTALTSTSPVRVTHTEQVSSGNTISVSKNTPTINSGTDPVSATTSVAGAIYSTQNVNKGGSISVSQGTPVKNLGTTQITGTANVAGTITKNDGTTISVPVGGEITLNPGDSFTPSGDGTFTATNEGILGTITSQVSAGGTITLNSGEAFVANEAGSLTLTSDGTLDVTKVYQAGEEIQLKEGDRYFVAEDAVFEFITAGAFTVSKGATLTSIVSYPKSLGKCSIIEDTSDDCEDGFLTYSWTSKWDWKDNAYALKESVPGYSVNDPKSFIMEAFTGGDFHIFTSKRASCESKNVEIACPAQVQLPFFTWINLLIALMVIALIYYFSSCKKKLKCKCKK